MVNQTGRQDSFLTQNGVDHEGDHDRFSMERFGAQSPVTTWSSLLTHHAGKFDKHAIGTTVLDDSFPRRWKLLITVIDCSHMPRLLNPPRSIEALKARLSAAVGIDSATKSHHGHPEATAQAIVTGLEGPERKTLDNDEDLCLFWENVRSGEAGAASPARSRSSTNLEDRTPSKLDHSKAGHHSRHRDRGNSSVGDTPTANTTTDSDAPDFHNSRGSRAERPSSSRPLMPGGDMTETRDLLAVEEESEQDGSIPDYERSAEQRMKDMQREMVIHEEQRFAAEARLQDIEMQLENMTYRKDDFEHKLEESEQKCKTLQDENLQFIKAFDEHVDQAKTELAAELEKKYSAAIQEQGKIAADFKSQVGRLEGVILIRDDKIKDLEHTLREQRAAFTKLAAGHEEEREKFEEERKRLASKVQRVRQLEFFADCWRRKVQELTDVSGKELREQEDSLKYRIGTITAKLVDFQKGRLVQSPEFEVPELGKVQFEFFPTGDVNSREGWCSFRLRVPQDTRLRWSAFIGKRRIGPRTDHFDQRQWWCRYGLLWLNFCTLDEVRAEISPETDTLLCGIEVEEILPNISGTDGSTPLEAAMPAPRDPFAMPRKTPGAPGGGLGLGARILSQVLATSDQKAEVSAAMLAEEVLGHSLVEADARQGATLALASYRPRGDGGSRLMLPPPTSNSAGSSAMLGSSGSRSTLPQKLGPGNNMLKPPALLPTSPASVAAGRKLARPQSVPSTAFRKNAQRNR